MLTFLLFIVVLSVLVFVHEIGHFAAARRLGVGVEEFGFGFPPRIVGFRRGQTIYSINAIPFGGFVRLKGEADPAATAPDSFLTAPLGRRATIIGAGVVMNFFFTIALLIAGLAAGLPSTVDQTLPGAKVKNIQVLVTTVTANSPAGQAGLKPGDIITAANTKAVTTDAELRSVFESNLAQPVTLSLRRDQESKTLTVVPARLDDSGKARVGVGLQTFGTASYPIHWAVINGVRLSFELGWQVIVSFAGFMRDLVIHQQVSADVAGPVGIAVLVGQVAHLGFFALLQFTALLSLSLAVINVLPLPALDGGRLLFLAIEALRGKAINRRVETLVHNVGFALLLLFVLLVSIQDVYRFGLSQRMSQVVRSLLH